MDIIGAHHPGAQVPTYLAFFGPEEDAFNGHARVRPYCICVVR